jgi:hypothetical protein
MYESLMVQQAAGDAFTRYMTNAGRACTTSTVVIANS